MYTVLNTFCSIEITLTILYSYILQQHSHSV